MFHLYIDFWCIQIISWLSVGEKVYHEIERDQIWKYQRFEDMNINHSEVLQYMLMYHLLVIYQSSWCPQLIRVILYYHVPQIIFHLNVSKVFTNRIMWIHVFEAQIYLGLYSMLKPYLKVAKIVPILRLETQTWEEKVTVCAEWAFLQIFPFSYDMT